MSTVIGKLDSTARRVVKTLLVENIRHARTPEFQSVVKMELERFGWQPEKISQAMGEIQEILRQGH